MSKEDLKRWCEGNFPHPIKWTGDDGLTRSPLREDKNPSFSVNVEHRCFNDLGTSDKGTFTELAERLGVDPPAYDGGNSHRASKAPRKEEVKGAEDEKIEKARRLWDAGSPVPVDHPYLAAKGIAPYGCRVDSKGWLLVPGYDVVTGQLVAVQAVAPAQGTDGKWQKLHNGPKKGIVWPCGDAPKKDSPVVLVEGQSTAASVKEILGEDYQVLCTFGCNNVKGVAETLRDQSPDREIIIATDGDKAGEDAFKDTAKAVPGVLRCLPDKGIDWNDAVAQRGIEEARRDLVDRLKTSRAVAEIKALAEEKRREVKAVSIGDIWDTEYPATKWAVTQLVPAGLSILASPPKRGKSWLVLQMALAVSEGRSFLGQTTTQGPVIYAALEDTPRRIQDRAKGLSMRRPSNALSLVFDLPPLDHGGMEELARLILKENPALVIVDTWGKVKPSPEKGLNAFEADYKMAGPLKKLADKTGTAILLVHHLKKGASKGEDIESMSGSMGLPAAADALIFLKRVEGEDRAKLDRQGRDLDETESIPLLWDGPGWRRATSEEVFVQETETLPEKEALIIAFFEDMGVPLTTAQVAGGTNEKPDNVRKQLSRLVDKGLLIRKARGLYQLPQEEEKRDVVDDLFSVTSVTSVTSVPLVTSVTSLRDGERDNVTESDFLVTFDNSSNTNGSETERDNVTNVTSFSPPPQKKTSADLNGEGGESNKATEDPSPCGESLSDMARRVGATEEELIEGIRELNDFRASHGDDLETFEEEAVGPPDDPEYLDSLMALEPTCEYESGGGGLW